MKQKYTQYCLNELFEARVPTKIKLSSKKNRISRAEVRNIAPSVARVELPRKNRYSPAEPREKCQEWILWLLQCGLIDRSYWPVSHSGLYTDFT